VDDTQGLPAEERTVTEVQGGRAAERRTGVIAEEPLSLVLNGHPAAVLMRLPGMEKELAVGFCLSEGLVRSYEDVLGVHDCGPALADGRKALPSDETCNRVEVTANPDGVAPDARLEITRLVRAGCGAVDLGGAGLSLRPVTSQVHVDAATLFSLPQAMQGAQTLRRAVGGVHAAGLFQQDGTPLVVCEDIGRHNAVDKAIGYCLLHGISIREAILLCSGRLSYEMAMKAIRVGIPILASIAVPTSLAVALAERCNLTMVCNVRGERMTLYAHPERITVDASGPPAPAV